MERKKRKNKKKRKKETDKSASSFKFLQQMHLFLSTVTLFNQK